MKKMLLLTHWLFVSCIILLIPAQSEAQDRSNMFDVTQNLNDLVSGSSDKPFVVHSREFDNHRNFYVTFNLPDRESVLCELVDYTGKQITHETLDDVLNETYSLRTDRIDAGLYILRLKIGKEYFSSKVYIKT